MTAPDIELPPPDLVPVDWRARCSKCSRYVPWDSLGTVYAPWGPNLEYDGYIDMCCCSKCGQQPVAYSPSKWAPLGPDNCDHVSWSGVDETPLDDPAKVWKCDSCDVIRADVEVPF